MNGYISLPVAGGGGGGSSAFKTAVASTSALPSSGLSDGDTYMVLSDYSLWTWSAGASRWLKQIPYVPKKSLTLDGISKSVSLGGNFPYDITSIFSISSWVKPTTNAVYMALASKIDGGNVGWILGFDIANSAFYFTFYNGAGTNAFVRTGAIVSTNVWYNVVVTYDGTQDVSGLKIYVNGVLQTPGGTSNSWGGSVASSSTAMIGNSGTGNVFVGPVDEYSFYTGSVLTGTQVAELYNLGLPFDLATASFYSLLTNWYRIGDTPDNYTTIYDSVGTINGTGTNLVNTDFTGDIP